MAERNAQIASLDGMKKKEKKNILLSKRLCQSALLN